MPQPQNRESGAQLLEVEHIPEEAAAREEAELGPPTEHILSEGGASPVELAVVWIEKARKGSIQWVDECSESQVRIYRFRKRSRPFVHLVMFMYLGLAVVEQPSWCLGDKHPCADRFADMQSMMLPVLPFQLSNSLEIVFLFVFCLRTWLRARSLGKANAGGGWQKFTMFMLAISLVDCTVAIFNTKGIVPGTFRIARLCRPLVFMSCHKHLRRTAARVVRAVPAFLNVLISLGIFVLIFVWLGVILFASSKEGDEYFHSWDEAFASMWILFTTSNNPDVWVPGYNSSRWTFIFIFIYLVVSLYLLQNVLLAAIYDSYKQQLKTSLIRFFENRQAAIKHAFNLLADSNGQISRERWGIFFVCYCDPHFGGTSQAFNLQRSRIVFDALDCDHSGGIDLEEFMLIVDVLHNPNLFITRQPVMKEHKTCFMRGLSQFAVDGFEVLGKKVKWEYIVDLLITIDICLTLWQTVVFVSPDLGGGSFKTSAFMAPEPYFYISFALVCFYFVEIHAKLYVQGCHRFFYQDKFRNRFDLLIVYCLLVSQVLKVTTPTDSIIRVAVLIHICRVLRLFWYIGPIRQLFIVMKRLAATYWRLGLLLFIVFYIYATIGEQVFGGMIRQDGGKYSKLLEGSAFEAADYWALNFNDFLSGMVVLFILMVVNNWMIIADAFWRVTGTAASQIYFVSFFIVVNLIVLNILMALILDCFSTLRDDLEAERHGEARQAFDREAVLRRVFQGEIDTDHLDARRESAVESLRRATQAMSDTSLHASESGSSLQPSPKQGAKRAGILVAATSASSEQ